MRCNKCGSHIDDGDKFCPYCGEPCVKNVNDGNGTADGRQSGYGGFGQGFSDNGMNNADHGGGFNSTRYRSIQDTFALRALKDVFSGKLFIILTFIISIDVVRSFIFSLFSDNVSIDLFGIVLSVGLWLIYTGSRNNNIKTSGFTCISVVFILTLIGYYFVTIASVIGMISISGVMSVGASAFTEYGITEETVNMIIEILPIILGVVLPFAIVTSIVGIAVYTVGRKYVNGLKDTVEKGRVFLYKPKVIEKLLIAFIVITAASFVFQLFSGMISEKVYLAIQNVLTEFGATDASMTPPTYDVSYYYGFLSNAVAVIEAILVFLIVKKLNVALTEADEKSRQRGYCDNGSYYAGNGGYGNNGGYGSGGQRDPFNVGGAGGDPFSNGGGGDPFSHSGNDDDPFDHKGY